MFTGVRTQGRDRIFHRRLGLKVQGCAMVLLLAVGFGLGVAALQTPQGQHPVAENRDADAFLRGHMANAINQTLAHDLPVDALFRAAAGELRWALFRSGGAQVWVGRNDWLYVMDELRPWPNAAANMARRADILAQVAARLKARHIDLVVAIVPDKARVVAENMDGPRSAQATARLAQWISMLRSRGIMPVNIYDSVLKRPDRAALWWRTDTHWSQQGAKLGAQAIADAVVTKIDRSHHFVTTEEAVLSDAPGDMLRLMALDKLPDQFGIKLRPAIDRQHRAHTVEQQTGPSDGLLDAGPEIEVALMGTSFSLNANFAGYLEQALGAKVLNTAEFGGGFARSAAHYLNGRTFRETTPRLIIWEMSERVVGQPLNAEDSALAAWAEHAD